MTDNLDERRCGYTVTDRDFIEQPCNRPATGWRWYQDCDHEDALDVACDFHANEGGQRIHDLEARLRDALAENVELALRLSNAANARDAAEAKLAAAQKALGDLERQLIHGYPRQHAPLLSAQEVRVSVLDYIRAALDAEAVTDR